MTQFLKDETRSVKVSFENLPLLEDAINEEIEIEKLSNFEENENEWDILD